MDKLPIDIKYFDKDMPKIKKFAVGDWVDLRSAVDITLRAGDYKLLPLGVAMKLPEGYEAYILPRSSTFNNFKMVQTNSCGIIDESYCGNNDQWFMPILALEDGIISKYDRVCQFRIQKKMPEIEFNEVETLEDVNRGGYGSTGVK